MAPEEQRAMLIKCGADDFDGYTLVADSDLCKYTAAVEAKMTNQKTRHASPASRSNAGLGVTEQRRAIAAAVKTYDGLVHFMPPPYRHCHTVHALHWDNGGLIVAQGEQGFVMSDGTFADREEAGQCAIASGQIQELAHPPRLYSEDLW